MSNKQAKVKVLDHRDHEIIQHFINFLGTPKSISQTNEVRKPTPSPISILEFAPNSKNNFWVYATIGANRRPMPYPKDWTDEKPELRVEFIICLNRPQPGTEIADSLTFLVEFPFVHNTFFDEGHVIDGSARGGIVQSSPLTDFFFENAYYYKQGLQFAHHEDGSHSRVLWVIPLYSSERLFYKKYGHESLLEIFNKDQTNLFDLQRLPAVK